jgi:exodeoxyribonuclease VIII
MMEPGIHFNISNDEYHADRSAVGRSGLMAMLRSPAYYYGQYLDPACPPESDTESAARLFGNMVDCAMTEPAALNTRYLVGPDVNKNTNEWKAFKKECVAAGAQAVDADALKRAKAARAGAMRVPDIARLFSKGFGQVTACAIDPTTGVKIKVRPDHVYPVNDKQVILADVKTYKSCDEEDFGRVQVVSMGYDIQDVLYSDVYARASGMEVLGFIFIVIEAEYPHVTAQMELAPEARASAQRKVRRALDTYHECRTTNVWPGHGDDLKTIVVPPYHLE